MNENKTEIIKYSKECINGIGEKFWVGIERPFRTDIEDRMDSGLRLIKDVQLLEEQAKQHGSSYYTNHQAINQSGQIPEIKVENPLDSLSIFLAHIEGAETLPELATFHILAKSTPQLQEAYNKRHQELSK